MEKEIITETLSAQIQSNAQDSLQSMQIDMEVQRNLIIAQIRKKAEEETAVYIEQELSDLKNNLIQNESQTKWKVKRDLLERRAQLVNELFTEVRDDLIAFTNKTDYKTWCLDQLNVANTQGELGKASIKIRSVDQPMFESLLTESDVTFSIIVSEFITIGGFILISENRRLEMDRTFDSLLQSQREWFFAHSQLVL